MNGASVLKTSGYQKISVSQQRGRQVASLEKMGCKNGHEPGEIAAGSSRTDVSGFP
jgi:hypothetical protein